MISKKTKSPLSLSILARFFLSYSLHKNHQAARGQTTPVSTSHRYFDGKKHVTFS